MAYTYSNSSTQAYVNALRADIAARDGRIATMRRESAQKSQYKRLAWNTVKIADLNPDEQSKIIRLNKES